MVTLVYWPIQNKPYIAKLTFNDGVLSLDRNSEKYQNHQWPNKDDYGIFDGADSNKKLTLGYDGTSAFQRLFWSPF